MFPGFFLALLYLIYIIGWALIDPKIAPKSVVKIPVSDWVLSSGSLFAQHAVRPGSALVAPAKAVNPDRRSRDDLSASGGNFVAALFPLMLCAVTLWGIWWYVVIHPMADVVPRAAGAGTSENRRAPPLRRGPRTPAGREAQELGAGGTARARPREGGEEPAEMGSPELLSRAQAARRIGPPPSSSPSSGSIVAATVADAALVLLEDASRAVRAAEAADLVGHAARHS
jgi:hypothetical protein